MMTITACRYEAEVTVEVAGSLQDVGQLEVGPEAISTAFTEELGTCIECGKLGIVYPPAPPPMPPAAPPMPPAAPPVPPLPPSPPFDPPGLPPPGSPEPLHLPPLPPLSPPPEFQALLSFRLKQCGDTEPIIQLTIVETASALIRVLPKDSSLPFVRVTKRRIISVQLVLPYAVPPEEILQAATNAACADVGSNECEVSAEMSDAQAAPARSVYTFYSLSVSLSSRAIRAFAFADGISDDGVQVRGGHPGNQPTCTC